MHPTPQGQWNEISAKAEWFWEIKFKPILMRCLAIFCAFLSIVILISECSLALPNNYDDFVFSIFLKTIISGSYGHTMIFILILMGYLCFCTYYGIFNFKVSGFYGLYPYHQTDPSNLVYSGLYLAKLAAPLCVNFLMFIHFENHQGTVFDKVAGRGMSWSFVNSFLKYFPCVILILCLMYYFEVYSKVMKSLGLDEYTYYNFYEPDKMESGIQILKNERLAILYEKSSPRSRKKYEVVFFYEFKKI